MSETQKEFAKAARNALAKNCTLEHVSSVYEAHRVGSSACVERSAIRRGVEEVGAFGILVPEDVGGVGLTEVEALLFCYEAGYAALPLPIASTLWSAPILAATGVVQPDAWASVAMVQADGRVAYCTDADYLLDFCADGASIRRVLDVDEVDDVVDWARPVGSVVPGDLTLQIGQREADQARVFMKLGSAAYMLGLAQRALDLTVEYVTDRVQFGVPVGSFQAVKHQLADAHIAIASSEPVLWHASASLSRAFSELELASAQLLIGRAAMKVGRVAIQCHGGMGYTTEYPLHLICKRIWSVEGVMGERDKNVFRIADHLGLNSI
ncbi:acyl-CoA dehydrogenase [Brevibacterium luteolum]|nr:acyl-CoA dehydrogenase [Brevibacterium luteolum]